MFKSEGNVAADAVPVWLLHWLQQSHPQDAIHQPSSPSTASAQWVNFYFMWGFMCIKMRQDPLTLALVTLLSKHTPVDREEIQVRPLQGPCRQCADSSDLSPTNVLTRWTLCSGSRRWADAGTSTWTCAHWPGGSCASRHLVAFL